MFTSVWSKVVLFSVTLFLIRIADGIVSFWAPNQVQGVLNNSVVMGLIISFQSVVGLSADLIFPRILAATKAKRLVFWAILMSAVTSLTLVSSIFIPISAIFLVTMFLWGIYYELITFANYQFMGSVVPLNLRSGAWGIAGIFSNLAYFLGPLLGTFLLLRGYKVTEATILAFLFAAVVLLISTGKTHDAETQINLAEINPWIELKHWLTLSEHIWPLIIISLLLGFIDSTFWTTGAVWTEKLAKINSLGGLFLPFYQFPAIFLGFVVARWGIYKGKKILSEKILIIAGLFLFGLVFSGTVIWQLAMVLLAGAALAVCYPLVEGITTDLVARMGSEKDEMIGLTSSIINLSYIIWPPIAGLISSQLGERLTFGAVGGMVVIISIVLLLITPKKLRLPQEEMQSWKE